MKKMGRIALLAVAVLLGACAGAPTTPPAESEAGIDAGYGRVFGRVLYIRNGQQVEFNSGFFETHLLRLFLRQAPAGRLEELRVENDGTFVWPLRPGEYQVVAFRYTRTAGAQQRATGRLMHSVSLPQAGQAVYAGDLRIVESGPVSLADRYADTLARVESRLSAANMQPMKGLMRPEPPTGRFKRVVNICSTIIWQLECGGGYQGVEPVSPPGTVEGYPVTDSLTPLLEWKPAGRPDVTYDVAVYESISLTGADLGNLHRLRGALVAYAEGLKEPRWSPPALQPGAMYEWTVRLRQDSELVSSWSTTSQFAFLVVAVAQGSGRYFGLQAPSR